VDDDLVEPDRHLGRVPQVSAVLEGPLEGGLDGVLRVSWIAADHARESDEPAIFVRQDRLEGRRLVAHRRWTPQHRPPGGDRRAHLQHCSHDYLYDPGRMANGSPERRNQLETACSAETADPRTMTRSWA
jgi:hypothetical protein